LSIIPVLVDTRADASLLVVLSWPATFT